MIRPCDSEEVLKRLGYEFEKYKEPKSEPEISKRRFDEFVPSIERLKGVRMYKHQEEAFDALREGKNIILVSGTGSGKTEAWSIPAIFLGLKVLAVYPTLALAGDQLRRLREYYKSVGLERGVVNLDAKTLRKIRQRGISPFTKETRVIVTNPAFLLQELKRIAEGRGILAPFLREVDLLVFDELDFYGSHGSSIIMGIIDIIANEISKKRPMVALLTATLGNPHEVAELITSLTKRETKVIEGRPLKVENRGYIIIGKNLKELWRSILSKKDEIAKKIPDILKEISDYKSFRENVYLIVELLRSKGIYVPSPTIDYVELLSYYAISGRGLTLVFTSSIVMAEKIYKTLISKLPPQYKSFVAVHHHMVDKSKREEIEDKAREGTLRVLISPRTMAQGIDIGNVIRVVHIGLPESLREFKQREGRKGRRGDIEFTETIIIPYKRWDRKLIERGVSALRSWVSMPLERLYVNTENKWVLLFTGLWRLIAHRNPHKEIKILEELGLAKNGEITPQGIKVFRHLGFYEYGPPYGIPRYLIKDGERRKLEDVGKRDLVERFQPGSFDYTSDALVVDVNEEGIIEMDLNDAMREYEWVEEAIQQYFAAKARWGERGDPIMDYRMGKLSSRVELIVEPPLNGFGKLKEMPYRVVWIVESRKPNVRRIKDKLVPIYEKEFIELGSTTKGKYEDFTYGYMYYLDHDWDDIYIRASLAYILAVLRMRLAFDIKEVAFTVNVIPQPYFVLWEPEAAGIIEKLEWDLIRDFVVSHNHDTLTEIISMMIDSDAIDVVMKELDWDKLRNASLRLIDEITAEVPEIPRTIGTGVAIDWGLNIVMAYDGKSFKQWRLDDINSIIDLSRFIESKVREGEKILYYKVEREFNILARKHPLLFATLNNAYMKGAILNVYTKAKKVLKLKNASLARIMQKMGYDVPLVKDERSLEKYLRLSTQAIRSIFAYLNEIGGEK